MGIKSLGKITHLVLLVLIAIKLIGCTNIFNDSATNDAGVAETPDKLQTVTSSPSLTSTISPSSTSTATVTRSPSPIPSLTLTPTFTPTIEITPMHPQISLENLPNLKEISNLIVKNPFFGDASLIAWAQNSEIFAYVDKTNINIFSIHTGEIIKSFESPGYYQISFTSDEYLIAPTGGINIKRWNASTFGPSAPIRSPLCKLNGGISMSQDGEYFATGINLGSVRNPQMGSFLNLWHGNQCIATILDNVQGTVGAFGFNFDSSLLFYDLNQQIVIIEVASQKEICRISANGANFNPRENTILVGKNGLTFWDPIACVPLRTIEKYPFCVSYEYSPSSNLVIGAALAVIADSNNLIIDELGWKLIVWDLESGEVVYVSEVFEGIFSQLEVSPDGRYILVSVNQKLDIPASIYLFAIEN